MDLAFTQGLSGIALAYASVQAPMLAGLARERVPMRTYLLSPLVAAPLATIAGLGMAMATPVLNGLGFPPHGLLHFALGTSMAAALGYSSGRKTAHHAPSDPIHHRGTLIAEAARPARRLRIAPVHSREITVAGTRIPPADETKHFKVMGTTGTGKSTAIEEILAKALARGDRAVIADPDGGYLRRFHDAARGDQVLNPFDPRSAKWDLFGEIRHDYDVEQLARSLIPDHAGEDRTWRSYARTFFGAVTGQVFHGGVRDVGELYRLLVVADTAELRTLVRGTPAQPFLDEHNAKMFDSIRSVTSSAVRPLEYVARQSRAPLSIRDWVGRESRGVLFMPYKAAQIAALSSTISGWMRLAIFEAMNQDVQPDERSGSEPRRLWFVVDELDALGHIDGLKDALARLRKFGGRCVLGFQSIAQVSSTYGQGDAHTIVENCANTLILRCSASEGGGTARFASQLIGEREVLRTSTSRSRRATEFFGTVSQSEHINREPAVLPSQIEQLPDLAGFLKQASDPVWRRVRLDAVHRWTRSRQEPAPNPPPALRQADRSAEARSRD